MPTNPQELVTISREELAAAVEAGIRSAFQAPELHCRYQIDPDRHERQHDALEKFIKFTAKVDDLKWSAMKAAVIWFIIGAFTLMMLGGAVKIRLLDVFGGP
jgi:hypothetical protein